MLRINVNVSAAGAKSYYTTSDYYSEGQELVGLWRGKAAERLGLRGVIEKKDWEALCDNRHPVTGQTLTVRQKSVRRVLYDFNFHCPKSVSLLYAMTNDDRIMDAFQRSVDETMRDMEAEMMTRVRTGGRNEDRVTGNMVYGVFTHLTARPVDGVPDIHLHTHACVFNITRDYKETRWKAAQFVGLKRDAPYFEGKFHARLARKLEELGLPVERTRKGWELAGLVPGTLEKFSRRTALIEETAKSKGIVDADVKAELGAKTRERKQSELSFPELQQEWRSRLDMEEGVALERLGTQIGGPAIGEDAGVAREAVDRSIEHCFERRSVVPERVVLARTMKNAVGAASPATVEREFQRRGLITAERDGRRFVTTREVLAEERRMLAFARDGRGSHDRLAPAPGTHQFQRDWLSDEQRRAVIHLLSSRDRVTLLRGRAGTGKTAMMQEAAEAIERGGRRVFTFAPSADASRGVLRQEGFASADTVARLLVDEQLQAQIRGQVIWVDEAGLLGTRTMAKLFDLAEREDARVILSGDQRQHGSVERGATLRLLEEEAGLVPAELRDIKRQRGEYKEAVQALSEGHTEAGFRGLDRLGWIREAPQTERYKQMAQDYVEIVSRGKSALVVSPTHLEGEWISDEIRAHLKQSGALKPGERRLLALESADFTEAERRDPLNYAPGDVLVFHQNAKGFQKGQRVVLSEHDAPPVSEAARYQVFRPSILPIAPGETIRITRNGMTADGKHRLNNGAIYRVKQFDRRGNLVLDNGWTMSKDYCCLAHGYCVTSQNSQGRTVDFVLVGQSSQSFPASSREQFYVSASRGRDGVTVYTDDKEALLDAVSHSDGRLSATEFVAQRELDRERSMEPAHRLAMETIRRHAEELTRE